MHWVPEQHAPGLSRQLAPTPRQDGPQYCDGAHADAVPLDRGQQHPLAQSLSVLHKAEHVPFVGERESTTHTSPTQQAVGSLLQTVPSGEQLGAPLEPPLDVVPPVRIALPPLPPIPPPPPAFRATQRLDAQMSPALHV